MTSWPSAAFSLRLARLSVLLSGWPVLKGSIYSIMNQCQIANGSFDGWNHITGSDPGYIVTNIATNGKSATGL
jgi:hypothetical protein